MRETPEDLERLEQILHRSYTAAGEHLRSIFSDERRMSPEQIVRALRGVFMLNLATIDASGAPLVSPIDGLFYRGHFWFGFPPGAARIRHVRARPQVSASYTIGEDLCVLAHGRAHEVEQSSPAYAAYLEYAREVYTPGVWDYWQRQYADRESRGLTAWIEPRRMYATRMNPAAGE
jgi:nitroimidazol reductase NimA-like FMN-containing flavoprotein (pyridoxamine 5'-phosphate oxidase superfamily)